MEHDREKILNIIGKRLREMRTQKGISQENLALSAELHPTYIGRLERGEKCPTIDTIYKLARSLEVPIIDLLDIPTGDRACDTSAMYRIEAAMSELSAEDAMAIAEIVERIAQLKNIIAIGNIVAILITIITL